MPALLSCLLLSLLISLLPLTSAYAQTACGTLRLSQLEGPGLYQRAADGSTQGLDVDIARELSRRTGCEFAVEPTNVTRLWRALQMGLTDVTTGAVYTPERAQEADFLITARLRGKVLLPRRLAAQLEGPQAFLQAGEHSLGIIARARWPKATQAWIDALRVQGRVRESGDLASLMRAYEVGRVSAVLLLPTVLLGRSEEWLESQALVDWFPESSFIAGWAVSKRVPEPVRRSLRQAADAGWRDGSWRRLALTHFGPFVASHVTMVEAPAPSPSAPGSPP